jgi:hypothetical protein
VHWLQALSDLQSLKAWGKPRTWRYWSIPAYALAHKMNPKTFCKRFREMEEIATRLFSDSVPASRKQRGPLTEAEKISIRKRYLQGEDCAALAQEFGLKSSHVGLLCRKEKAARRTEQEAKAAKENESAPMQEIVEPAQPF